MYNDPDDLDVVFEYTDSENPNSSWLPEIYYNRNTSTLVVNVEHDGDDVFYKFDNVPLNVWEEFVAAPSKGAYFNRSIKGRDNYGPATNLGDYMDVEGIEVPVTPQPVLTSVKSTWSGRPVTHMTIRSDGSVSWNVPVEGTGTPKGLVVAAPENAANNAPAYVSLAAAVDNSNLRRFVVAFEVGGKNASYELYEADWNAAAVAVETLGDQLGQNFKIKGLSVVD